MTIKNMNAQTLFDNFDLLADAPNGVEKLRELILQLAVQGKLVRQDSKDELASVLLAKMRQEKTRLIQEKKIKKTIELPEIGKEDEPHEIPSTWEWIRLNDVGEWGSGSTPDRTKSVYYGGDIVWLKSGELRDDRNLKDSEEKITRDALRDCSLRENKPGDVLIAMYGATVGKLAILDVEATTNQAVCACTSFKGFYNQYLFYLLMAYRNYFINESAGAAQPNFSKDKIIRTVVPLPPLAEQRRIVSRVDELMALCDELEEQKKKKQETHTAFNESALAHLLEAKDAKEFAEHWQRICDHFEILYDAPESITKLRSAILQLAVQGKLVKQDPKDEPASVLLEKILEEKERLIAEKKIKKSEPLPPIKDDEIPYELPEGWVWARLGDATGFGIRERAGEITDSTWVLDLEDIEKDTSRIIQKIRFKDRHSLSDKSMFHKGNILYGKLRPYLNKVVIADEDGVCTTEIMPINCFSGFVAKYLLYSLKSPDFLEYVNSKSYGVKMPRLGTDDGKLALLSVPPLDEQRRIATKVDELISYCDELETKLTQAESASENLLTAVVREMVEG